MALTYPAPMLNIDRMYTGLVTQRNVLIPPIRVFGRRIIELFDSLVLCSNMEISNRLTLRRRPGYIQYNTTFPVPGTVQKFYTFQPQGNLYPIIDSTAGVFQVNPGNVAGTTLTTKTQGAQSSFKYIGNYLYIGNQEFEKKVDQNLTVTNWGIVAPNPSGSLAAYAGTGADVAFGTVFPWANPTRVQGSPDGSYTTVTPVAPVKVGVTNGSATSDMLQATNYGSLAGLGTIITGVQLDLTGFVTNNSPGNTQAQVFVNAFLIQSGGIIGNGKYVSLTGVSSTVTVGGPSDNWGAALTSGIINSGTFGIGISIYVVNHSTTLTSSFTCNIDAALVTVSSIVAPTVTPAGSGAFAAVSGYVYVYAYGSSQDGSLSNPTLPSNNTGVFSGKLNVQIPVVASTDPQVNQIRVFRTTDGGGSTFFELPTSPYPNTSTTILDNSADSTLTIQNQVVSPSFAWSPPPGGLQLMEWYAGRLWGAVGNLLYFAAGPDNIIGNPNTAWPPANVFVLPTTITKLVAMPFGMMVFTYDDVHIVQGIQNPGFTVNRYVQGLGVRQQNAVDSDGSNIYVYTSDQQFLNLNANGIEQVGQNIGDLLDTLDPTKVYVAVHRSGSEDNHLFISDGSTNIYPYNLTQAAWEGIQKVFGGSNAIDSIEISPGVHKLLLSYPGTFGLVLQRDLNTFSDYGNPYPAFAQFGSIPLADPGQLAIVRAIVLKLSAATSAPTVFGLFNEISGTGLQLNANTAPLSMPSEYAGTPFASTTYQCLEYLTETVNTPEGLLHMQFNVQFGATATYDEILGWAIYGPLPPFEQQQAALPQLQGR